MLHDAFLKRLKREIGVFGPEKMSRFVRQLKELNRYAWAKCQIETFVNLGLVAYRAGCVRRTKCA